jgi:twitching motility protein PilT
VPALDRYLDALAKHRGEALVLRAGSPIELVVGGASRPATSKPVTEEQIMNLLTEALGAAYAAGVSGHRTYKYASTTGQAEVDVDDGPMGLSVRVSPLKPANNVTPAPASPPAPIAPRPTPPSTASINLARDTAGFGEPAPLVTPGTPALAMPAAPPAPPIVSPAATAPAPTAAITSGASASVSVSAGNTRDIDELFHHMMDLKASDMHLKSEKAPMVRVDGSMMPMPGRGSLAGAALERLVQSIMPDRNLAEFKETNDSDFAYELPDKKIPGAIRARMRCNVFRDIIGVGAVFRQIPSKIMTAEDLKLPKACLEFCQYDKGLVVVTGPTGSGKSTTLAAMIDWINANRDDHIITIEDPVEFVHKDKKCLINQREVGTQTKSFKAALRAALREDPDIVLVGEMRDLETVAIAIETAETGHLVFGTLHTNTAPSTVDRLIDQFPTDRQSQIRVMLSESLKGVVAQTLLKRKGGGRVAALEILIVTHAVANLIREGKTFQIPSLMQTGRGLGMVTLNDSMIELVKNDIVEPEEAYDRAPHKKEFGILLNRLGAKGPWNEEVK